MKLAKVNEAKIKEVKYLHMDIEENSFSVCS